MTCQVELAGSPARWAGEVAPDFYTWCHFVFDASLFDRPGRWPQIFIHGAILSSTRHFLIACSAILCPQILIHGDASKTKWLGEMIFDSDGGHFVFDPSPCIKNLVGRESGPRFLYTVTRRS